jgi:hypothetical protein
MKKIRLRDLTPDQRLKVEMALNKNRISTKAKSIKTLFTKDELENNFTKYLRYN